MSDDMINDEGQELMGESWIEKLKSQAEEEGWEGDRDIGEAMMEAFGDQKSKDMGLKWT